jgi:hypothetical protein
MSISDTSCCAASADDVLRLAVAVAARDSWAHLYEDTTNDLAGWTTIEDAARGGVAFVIQLDRSVIGLDLDSPTEVAQLKPLTDVMRSMDLRPVVIGSGRPGHWHIFVRVRADTERERIESAVERLCGNRRPLRQDIRAPLSPHRQGLSVLLREPQTVEDALAYLVGDNGFDTATASRRLSDRIFRLLRYGDQTSRYESESEVVQAIAMGTVNSGWSERGLYAALTHERNVGGAKVQELLARRGEDHARRYVRRSYDRAAERIGARPAFRDRPEAILRLADQLAVVEDFPWRGSRGQRSKAVLVSIIRRAMREGSTTVRPSQRELAEEVGMARMTVTGVLDELDREVWLRIEHGRKGFQDSYEVLFRTRNIEPPSSHPQREIGSGLVLPVNHDAFSHGGGLGKAGRSVLLSLDEPFTASELAERTSLGVSAVRRICNLLLEYRIVEKEEQVWSRRSPLQVLAGLAVLARSKDTYGKGLRKRNRHQLERIEREAARDSNDERTEIQPARRAPDAARERGWVDPAAGEFWSWDVLGDEDGPLSPAHGPVVLTFARKGWPLSIALHDGALREVAWTEHADPTARSFPVSQRRRLPIPGPDTSNEPTDRG